jgi:hypothetical protein
MEQRVVHLFAVDLGYDANAAAVEVAEHRDAVALGERVYARVVGVPLLTLLDQPRQGLLAVAVVAYPQRQLFLTDAGFSLRLEVDVNAEFDQGLEPLLRFVEPERNHVCRDDEEFRIRELSTPAEPVAVEPTPQADFAVNAAPEVFDVDHVLHIYPRIRTTGAVRVRDEMLLLAPKRFGLRSSARRLHGAQVLGAKARGFEDLLGRPQRTVQGLDALISPVPRTVRRERLDVGVRHLAQIHGAPGGGHARPRRERRAKLELLDSDGDALNGRLRHWDFHGHRPLRRPFRFPAQGRGKAQRLDVDDLKGLANLAHEGFLLSYRRDFPLPWLSRCALRAGVDLSLVYVRHFQIVHSQVLDCM